MTEYGNRGRGAVIPRSHPNPGTSGGPADARTAMARSGCRSAECGVPRVASVCTKASPGGRSCGSPLVTIGHCVLPVGDALMWSVTAECLSSARFDLCTTGGTRIAEVDQRALWPRRPFAGQSGTPGCEVRPAAASNAKSGRGGGARLRQAGDASADPGEAHDGRPSERRTGGGTAPVSPRGKPAVGGRWWTSLVVRCDRSVAPRRQAAHADGAARCDGPRCGSPDGRPDA